MPLILLILKSINVSSLGLKWNEECIDLGLGRSQPEVLTLTRVGRLQW